jgi:magnesium-transporting ATPase (P-type)
MDELKRLKKDWKENLKFPKLSKDEIYKLLHKKSSSIVKRIFVFSLIEFGFWTLLSFVIKDNEAQQRFDQYEMDHITLPLVVIGYAFLIYFFFMFYKNYKSISTTASSKGLMEQILKTRKTVKHYVIFNLLFLYISIVIGLFIELNNNPDVALRTAEFTASGDYYIFYGIMLATTLLMMALLTAILLGFYYLIYGILLKKLKNNYKELKKIELE